jgi:hypothetical protein
MPLQSKFGSFNTGVGAATTTVAITGVGFTPKCILFWWSGRTEAVDTIGRATHFRGFGVATSATNRSGIVTNSLDAQASSDTQSGFSTNWCIASIDGSPTIDGTVDVQSLDADGFTLIIDDAMPISFRVHYLALGGDSLTNANVISFNEPNATGNQDITGFGFDPDCVLFFGIRVVAGTRTTDTFSLGAACANGQGVYAGLSETAAATMDTASYCLSSECIAFISNAAGAAVVGRASFNALITDGIRITWAESNSAAPIVALGLKGGNYLIGNLLTRTDGNDIAETGFGFKPSSALFLSHGQAESTADTAQANNRWSMGAFSSLTDRGAQAILDEDNIADSEVTTAIEFDAVYANISTASAIQGLMDVKSIDADGFTMVMDDADPSQAFVWYLAFGPAEVVETGWGQLLSDKRNRAIL